MYIIIYRLVYFIEYTYRDLIISDAIQGHFRVHFRLLFPHPDLYPHLIPSV